MGAPPDPSPAAPTAAAREAAAAGPSGTADAPPPGARVRRRRLLFALAAVALIAAAFAIRLAYVGATPGMTLRDDGLDYDGHAVSIARTGRFSDTLAYGRPTAFRPPAFPYLLGEGYNDARVAREGATRRDDVPRRPQVASGTALGAGIAPLAAQVFGEVVALVELALAAV